MLKENSVKRSMSLVFGLLCCLSLVRGNDERVYDEEAGRAYLKKINADIQVKTTESVLASWAYESNITDENLRVQLEVSAKLANYTKEIWKETIKFPWKTFRDPDVRRQFHKFSVLGTAILSPPKYERFNKIISDMQSIYGKAKICNFKNRTNCSLQLEPELTEIFVKSRDPEELRYYWTEWRNAAGKPVRKMFKEYIDLSNEAAVLNNFTNNAEFWLKDYEVKDFRQQLEGLWQQLRPLYLQLHAYVRRRLREQYGEKHVTKRGPIPAHLLGNMWAQSWGNVFDFTAPYPGKPSMDVTPNMVEQGYTPLRMFRLAEEFFTSLNLSPMPDTFWKNSILEKPTDGRDLICHASAWDFYDGKDFRIKQCTRITMEDLNTVHHEMGHIQYFLQYKTQPLVYKEGTNPGFHEAVGDVMALSVSTPKHLRKIGLLNATEDDSESEINQLYNMALEKIAFLPFGYLMDQWRWSVFEGKTTERNYNCKWWQLREKYQGLLPSVARGEEDFDPGAKYHTVGNVPYIRYFVSFVIQFQFHRSLCIAAGEFDPQNPASKPLHKCDIYQSKEAGGLLKKMLQMGSSKPWPDAMEVITGQREMDARALLDYFDALHKWLVEENRKTGEYIGWESSQPECAWDEEQRASHLDTQGNFEDDNIAYSYAEFVRQDDNAFGFPDYLEEELPSYHSLRQRSEENEIPNYFIPKRAARKFPGEQNIFITDGSVGKGDDSLIELSKLQHEKDKGPEQRPQGEIAGARGYKMWKIPRHGSSFRKRTTTRDAENTKIIKAIIKDFQKLEKSQDTPLTHEEAFKWIASRDLSKVKEKVDSASQEDENQPETEDHQQQQQQLQQQEQQQQLGQQQQSQEQEQQQARQQPQEQQQQQQQPEAAPEGNSTQETVDSATESVPQDSMTMQTPSASEMFEAEGNVPEPVPKMNGKAEYILETAKKFSSKTLDYQLPNELMWKAELVKNEAEQMLKNFNLTFHSPRYTNLSRWVFHPTLPDPDETSENQISAPYSSYKNARNIFPLYKAPGHFKPRKALKLGMNSLEGLYKPSMFSSGRDVPNQKQFHFREYDLVDVIPVDSVLGQSAIKSEEKRSSSRGSSDFAYVMLVGRLAEKHFEDRDKEKKSKKKSYKEYHYNVRTPVVYNTVTINPPEMKPDKGEGLKEHSLKVSFRSSGLESRRTGREAQGTGLRPEEKSQRKVFSNKFSRDWIVLSKQGKQRGV